MLNLDAFSLKVKQGQLLLLDQQKLPHKEEWIAIENEAHFIQCVKDLKVRGAPLIGVSAAICLALEQSKKLSSIDEFLAMSERLRRSRPTAVNLMNALDRMNSAAKENFSTNSLLEKAGEIFFEDQELCQRIGKNGLEELKGRKHILTHCNTGSLATVGIGTAIGVLNLLSKQQELHVYVDETRPLLQGARLTSYELEKLKIPFTLLTDSMAAFLMAQSKVDAVLLGADRIATNGDFANKIGTLNLAILCKHFSIPFYVAAPRTTIDFHCLTGAQIPIEQRDAREVLGVHVAEYNLQWARESQVFNPSFDICPAELVTAWIFDDKVYRKAPFDRI